MVAVIVSKKGWVVIPKEIRERYGIRPGDKVHVFEAGGGITLIKAHKDPIKAGRGFLRGGPSMTEELLEERQRELEQEERDLAPPRPKP